MKHFIYAHQVGLCGKWKDCALVQIPKNASTWLRLWCPQPEFYFNFKPDWYYVLLRDPYERWISGICEYVLRNRENEQEVLKNLAQIEFDEHTAPQHHFLRFNYKRNTTFFNMSDNGIQEFNKNIFNVPYSKLNKVKPLEEETVKVYFKEKLLTAITKELKIKIKDYYYKDYELIERFCR